jgi:hypothetical protein
MNPIQVLQCSHNQCVIYNPPSHLGIYFSIAMHVACLALFVWLRYFRPAKITVNWRLFPVMYAISAIIVPLLAFGNSDKVIFARSDGTVTIQSEFMLVSQRSRVIPLDDVLNASVGGRNSWLFLNLRDGEQVSLSPDASLGGRENARDAINSWIAEYRESPGQNASRQNP